MKAYIVRIVKDPPKDGIRDGYGYYRIIAVAAETSEEAEKKALQYAGITDPEDFIIKVI